MRVMVIVKASKDSEAGVFPDEQLLTDMGRFNEALANAGVLVAGEGLKATAHGARGRFDGPGRTATRGPFPLTGDLIAGYWVWEVASLDDAIAWAERCPNPHAGACEVEIRPLVTADDFDPALTPELREQEGRLRAQAAAKS